MMGYYRKYYTDETIKIEYHYCALDPTQNGCRPGSRKECEHLKGVKFAQGITCPNIVYRKENEI